MPSRLKGWKRGSPRYFIWDVITKSIEGYETNYMAARSNAHRNQGMVLPVSDFTKYALREIAKYGDLGAYGQALGKKLGLIDQNFNARAVLKPADIRETPAPEQVSKEEKML